MNRMNKKTLHIAEPCAADWNEMHGDDQRRFCDDCTKHVHNLSAMNRDEAEAFLAEHRGDGICVQYLHDREGDLVFMDDPGARARMFWQRDGVQRLVAAAALALPLSLAACDQTPTTQVTAEPHAPIQIKDGAVKLSTTKSPPIHTEPAETVPQPGSGRAPTFPAKKTTPPEPVEHIERALGDVMAAPEPVEMVKGDVAAEPAHPTPPKTKKEAEKPSCEEDATRIMRGQVVAKPKTPAPTTATPAKKKARTKPKKTANSAEIGAIQGLLSE